ncbi:Polyketide synthase thioesterase domain-containing protein [Prescottella defluvii]
MADKHITNIGARVALADGRHAWEMPVSAFSDFAALATDVATELFPAATLAAVHTHGDMPTTGTVTATLSPHLGGASVQVHCRPHPGNGFVINTAGFALLFEAVVASGEAVPAPVVAAPEPQQAGSPRDELPETPVAEEVPAESGEIDVPPRDAAERLTFALWAVVTGKSAKSIFATLPILGDEAAEKLAARLTERSGGEITVDDVLYAGTIEQLAETVRQHLEDGLKIDGLVRTLRPRAEGSDAVPVFVFHPAGGSTVAYEPLLKRLPARTPMFGLERVEGPLHKRAEVYAPLLRKIQGDGPYVLCGWSFGGALAYAVAKQLRTDGADVRVVGLIDTVMPGEKVEDTPEEIRARWQRYAKFAKKTYNLDAPLPYDQLAAAGSDEEQIGILMDLLKLSSAKIPGGIIEHQRTSWLDNRAIPGTDLETYDGDVVLYMANTYLDDQIALEPAFRTRRPDGGWGDAVEKLEIVHVDCDHIQIVDEPYIAVVAADLSKKLAAAERN